MLKKFLAIAMAAVVSIGSFGIFSIDARAAGNGSEKLGNIPDKFVGEYVDEKGEVAITFTPNDVVYLNESRMGKTYEIATVNYMDASNAVYIGYTLTNNTLSCDTYAVIDAGDGTAQASFLTTLTLTKKAVEQSAPSAQPAPETTTETKPETKPETTQPAKTSSAAKAEPTKVYSAYIYEGKNAVEYTKELVKYIKTAKAGSTVEFVGQPDMMCYSRTLLDKLAERGEVSLKTIFTYDGITYSFTIPAGSDYSNIEDANFYGFMYLKDAFNGSVVE